MYSRGMSVRDIQGHLEEMYGVEVSPSLISDVTDGVMELARAWQNRPLDAFYAIVFLDALYVKMRHEGRVENRAVYVAIGINLEGKKDVLGLWTGASEGAKFWLNVLTELRNRGVKDIYLACVDGLKGFPQAIESVFPKAQVQLCIVHMIRASLNYVTWKDRKEVVSNLKPIYKAATADEAERQLSEFEEKWKKKYPAISRLWREQWERVIPFFAFPEEVRKIVYTTNAVESLSAYVYYARCKALAATVHATTSPVEPRAGRFPNTSLQTDQTTPPGSCRKSGESPGADDPSAPVAQVSGS